MSYGGLVLTIGETLQDTWFLVGLLSFFRVVRTRKLSEDLQKYNKNAHRVQTEGSEHDLVFIAKMLSMCQRRSHGLTFITTLSENNKYTSLNNIWVLQFPLNVIKYRTISPKSHYCSFLILFPYKTSYYLSNTPCWPNWLSCPASSQLYWFMPPAST